MTKEKRRADSYVGEEMVEKTKIGAEIGEEMGESENFGQITKSTKKKRKEENGKGYRRKTAYKEKNIIGMPVILVQKKGRLTK